MNIRLETITNDHNAKIMDKNCTEESYKLAKMGKQFELPGENSSFRFHDIKFKCPNCKIESYKLLRLIPRTMRINVSNISFKLWKNYFVPFNRLFEKNHIPCIYCKIDNAGCIRNYQLFDDNEYHICFTCVKYADYKDNKFDRCSNVHDYEEIFSNANELKKIIKLQEENFYKRLQYDGVFTLLTIWKTKRNNDLASLPRDLIKLIVSFIYYYKI